MNPSLNRPLLVLAILCVFGVSFTVFAQDRSTPVTDSSTEVTRADQTSDPNSTGDTAGLITDEDLFNLLEIISNQVDTSINRATSARDASQEIGDSVSAGVSALTVPLRTAIDGALDDLKRIVNEELGGAEFLAFTDGPNSCNPASCGAFRQDLLALLMDLEGGTNAIFLVTGLNNFQLDLQRLRGVIDVLPGRVLFPLYVVFKVDNGDLLGSLVSLMTELNSDLQMVGDVFATEEPPPAIAGTGTPTCTVMTNNPLVFEVIVLRTTARAIALKLVAKLFDALGETSATVDGGIHGYVHITYEENIPKKIASIIEALSESEFYIANAVQSKLEFCLALQIQTNAQERQLALLSGQDQILNAIQGNSDLNSDGVTDLTDYAVFRKRLDAARPTP